jgi:subtilisin family serine protease
MALARIVLLCVLFLGIASPAQAKRPAAPCKARHSKACKRYCAKHRRAKVCRKRAVRRPAPAKAPATPAPVAVPVPVAAPVAAPSRPDPDLACPPAPPKLLLPAAPGSGADPLREQQWGLDQIHGAEAWARSTGKGVVVAVIDSGTDHRHPDLRGRVLPGRDWVGDDACALDENGHGTHVAATIAAARDNGAGVAGVAPDATILPLRIADASGMGEFGDMNEAIRAAADGGARVVNISFGAGIATGQVGDWAPTEEATAYAFAKGTLVVTAAGNTSTPLCSYPAASAKVVCVAATDRRGLPAHYSNLPVNPDGLLALRAPGGDGNADPDSLNCEPPGGIISAYWPGAADDCGVRGYQLLSGSSQAAPHVAGVAALLAAQGLGPQQIVDRLKATASNHGTYDPVMGYGLVDAAAAVAG